MVDFSKHKHGDVVVVHCCDECARKAGVNPTASATDIVIEIGAPSVIANFNIYVDECEWIADTETRRMFLLMMAEELSYEVLE